MHILDIARVFNNDGEGKKTDKARYFSDVHSSNFQRRNFFITFGQRRFQNPKQNVEQR